MPNKKVFRTQGAGVAVADAKNEAGGIAYAMTPEHALAQLICTSTFNKTFYSDEESQLSEITRLAQQCSAEFVAKAAIYGHESARMKDAPVLMLCDLLRRSKEDGSLQSQMYFEGAFPRVITNFKQVRTFTTFIRSGKAGSRSFGSVAKRMVRKFFASRSGNALFTGSIGADPSFADVVKMIHPEPESNEKRAFYGYMLGRESEKWHPATPGDLPSKVQEFELFKSSLRDERNRDSSNPYFNVPVPDVPFQMLSSLPLRKEHWKEVARNMPWFALRMNLNTLQRHGVFDDPEMVDFVANKIRDPELVRRASAFPYQLLTAYQNTDSVPNKVRNALQDAMEIATENVPALDVPVAVCVDISSSMSSPITGHRVGSTSKTKCVDVAALIGACVLRKNEDAILLPFNTSVYSGHSLNGRDSVVTNAQRLASMCGGGTDCAAAMRVLNGYVGRKPELIIYVSDNESWFNGGRPRYGYGRGGTSMAQEWDAYKRRVKNAKLVCIDIQPYTTTQVQDSEGVLNIGGFTDKVWTAIERFSRSGDADWAGIIRESVNID